MIETLAGSALLTGAAIGLLIAISMRRSRSLSFGRYHGGGRVTFTGMVAFYVFVGSMGGMLLYHSAIWIIPVLSAWLFGYILQSRANRRHQTEEDELRRRNALQHPGIFDNSPPRDLDAIPGEQVDLYDAGACEFIGTVNKTDMRALATAFTDMPEQGPNDIFVILESLEFVPESEISQDFAALLRNALVHRDYLVLRWMPLSHHAQ
jgi:hypothetical protein